MSITSMFGLIVPGRLVQTNFECFSPTALVTTIFDADTISEVLIFLTGQLPFQEGTGGLVYYSAPSSADENGPTTWQLLGSITNEKPSALFKISSPKKGSLFSEEMLMFGQQITSPLARIGISIEPLAQVLEQTSSIHDELSNSVQHFGQKTVENFVNYITSFLVTPGSVPPSASEMYVPLSSVHTWFEKFKRRLQVEPNFWRA